MSCDPTNGIITISNQTKQGFNAFKLLSSVLNKIKHYQSLTFNEEYAIEALYHEILHLRVKDYSYSKKRDIFYIEALTQFG